MALRAFSHMYGAVQGKDPVMDFLGQTGSDALKGADILLRVFDESEYIIPQNKYLNTVWSVCLV